MAKSTANKKDSLPMSPEEYLLLDNLSAKEKLSKQSVSEAQSRRIHIYSPKEAFDTKKITKSNYNSKAIDFELPPGANIGLPGKQTQKFTVKEARSAIKSSANGDAYYPPSVDFTPHPKLAPTPATYIRRPNGKLIEPHYGVFGADDRTVYYPSGYPWICIGKIYTWNDFSQPYPSSSGSGVLIGGRVVLTAGHMVPWGSSNWAMQFVPAYYDGGSLLGAGVSSWVSDARGYNDPVSAWDMAVLRLYTPLGNTYGYFGAKTYNSGWEGGNYWTLAGYPGAVAGANRPSRQMWFPILDDDSSGDADELEYEADSTPGDSGGPVFGFWSGLPYSVGTVSGGEKITFLWWTIEDNNVSAGGAAMVDLILWARSNWP